MSAAPIWSGALFFSTLSFVVCSIFCIFAYKLNYIAQADVYTTIHDNV